MHIILVSDRMATARTFTVTVRHLLLVGALLVAAVLGLASLFSYVTVRHASEWRLPLVQDMLLSLRETEARRAEDFMRENLNAMAVRLGKMQAQLMHLNSLGDRLGKSTGIPPGELKSSEVGGEGGPLIEPVGTLDPLDLLQQIDQLSQQIELKADYLSLIDAELMDARIKRILLPTARPIDARWLTSSFGRRLDPFTGRQSMHEGLDFPAQIGTPIYASAAGIVVRAEHNHDYGNMVEIDHGNDLVTRYAHASKLLVKEGELVKRHQKIAEVGSTGRSTGPHLHFEVRYQGVAQNPSRYLQQAQAPLWVARAGK